MKKKQIFIFFITLVIAIIAVQIAYLRNEKKKREHQFKKEFYDLISLFPNVEGGYAFTKLDLNRLENYQPLKLESVRKFLRSKEFKFVNGELSSDYKYYPLFKTFQEQELIIGYLTQKINDNENIEFQFCSSDRVPFFGNVIQQRILINKIQSDTLLIVNDEQIVSSLYREMIEWDSIYDINYYDTTSFQELINHEENTFNGLMKTLSE